MRTDKLYQKEIVKRQIYQWKEGKHDATYNVTERTKIVRIGGKDEVRRHLEELGFVTGGLVTVVSEAAGNMIVNVKGARIAIGREMANHIFV